MWKCGSPRHAGPAAGCHHGTFPSCAPVLVVVLSSCAGTQHPLCPGRSAAAIRPSVGTLAALFLRGELWTRTGWTESEARRGGPGHFGFNRETELQGHGEGGRGAHPCLCCCFLSVLMEVFLLIKEAFHKRREAFSSSHIFGL